MTQGLELTKKQNAFKKLFIIDDHKGLWESK